MKQKIRTILVLLLIPFLLVAFTACETLDDLRNTQGFWEEDGSISLHGTRYLKLPPCEEIAIDAETDTFYITEPDVPVLLSSMYGDYFSRSEDARFLRGNGEFYCHSDHYEEIKTRIENGVEMDHFCYTEYRFIDGITRQVTTVLSRPAIQLLNDTVKNSTPMALPEGATMSFDQTVHIYRSSEDALFRTYAFKLCRLSESYYITVTETISGEETYYPIAEDGVSLIKEIFYS